MKCPICNSKMIGKGFLKITKGIGLPESCKIENIPYYLCENCSIVERGNFAFYRTFVNGNFYFYNWNKWNLLQEWNPSRREN